MSMYEAYVKHHWRVKSSRDAVCQERHRTKWRGSVQETLDICFVENRIQSDTEGYVVHVSSRFITPEEAEEEKYKRFKD